MTERERRDAFIRAEYGQGRMSAREIADRLGCGKNTVISRAHYLGLGSKPGNQALAQHISAMQRRPRTSHAKAKPAETKPKPEPIKRDPGRMVWNNTSTIPDRCRHGETERALERVAVRHHPAGRLCAWRTYEGNGRSLPCCEPAVPGSMWCAACSEKVKALKESA